MIKKFEEFSKNEGILDIFKKDETNGKIKNGERIDLEGTHYYAIKEGSRYFIYINGTPTDYYIDIIPTNGNLILAGRRMSNNKRVKVPSVQKALEYVYEKDKEQEAIEISKLDRYDEEI